MAVGTAAPPTSLALSPSTRDPAKVPVDAEEAVVGGEEGGVVPLPQLRFPLVRQPRCWQVGDK
jgi:hypothetical protein